MSKLAKVVKGTTLDFSPTRSCFHVTPTGGGEAVSLRRSSCGASTRPENPHQNWSDQRGKVIFPTDTQRNDLRVCVVTGSTVAIAAGPAAKATAQESLSGGNQRRYCVAGVNRP